MMTTRRIIPYILTIVAFDVVYWLTMVIPNQTLYLGYGQDWQEVIMNNKIPLQIEIFTYVLTFIIVGVNFLEIISTKDDKFLLRVTKSILTIILSYLGAALIFKFLDVKTWNLFYYYRGTPANIFILVTIILTSIGLVVLEALKRIYLFRFDKSLINKYVPSWLKLERNSL